MIQQNSAPRHEDARGREIDQPEEDGQGAIGQRHEAEEHEEGEQPDADVRGAPAGRPQKHAGRLPLEGQAVEHAGARQQALVGRGPGRRDDDGVDDGRDGADARGRGGDDKGALRRRARRVAQPGVVAGYQHAHDEHRQDVEEDDAREDALAGPRDRPPRVPRLGRRHGEGLDAREGEDGARHDAPVGQESAPVARGDGDQLDEGAGVLNQSVSIDPTTYRGKEVHNVTER